MRLAIALLTLSLPAATLAADSPAPVQDLSHPAEAAPQVVAPEPADDAAQAASEEARLAQDQCRDRIRLVREERGLPRLQRGTAEPDEPLLIAAVDRRIDGCGVLVMKNDINDIRPLPERYDGPLFRRLEPDQ